MQLFPSFKKPSLGERLSQSVGQGLEGLKQQMLLDRENQAFKKMGVDLGGINDPKLREKAVGELLRGQSKQNLMNQKMNMVQGLFGGQGQGQGEMLQGNSGGQLNAAEIPDEAIAQATLIDPNIGRMLQHAKDQALTQQRHTQEREDKITDQTRKESFELVKPILQRNDEARKNIPLQEQAIEDIIEAAPETGIRDYLADTFAFEPLRTAEGAKLKTAIKDFFLSDLSRAGARPNQWIEQQLADALPKLGRSTQANLITAEGMKFKVDLAKKRIEIIDRLADEDRKKYKGEVKPDVDARADKEMKKYVIDRQAELRDRIKEIKKTQDSAPSTHVLMVSPEGKPIMIDKRDIEEAMEHGYTREST